jgi:hypothetical protein
MLIELNYIDLISLFRQTCLFLVSTPLEGWWPHYE